jgi:hypothetical protein
VDRDQRLPQLQTGDDLALNPRRRRGRERRDRDAEKLLDLPQALVFRPKIVTPLLDAMRLIDHDVVRPVVVDRRGESFVRKAFRRDIKKPQPLCGPVIERLVPLVR